MFISYRRDDTEGEAGRLFDDLNRAFGNDAVFMDVSGIEPGTDFRKAIDDNVACCGVLLAMIGPTWATIAGSDGQRRLDNENDYVRLEIASALRRNIAVIPVLVHDAHMPHADQLPDNLKDLAYRNSVEITHARWNSDVQLLIQALGQYVNATKETETEPVHAAVPVQLPPLHAAPEAAPVRTKSNTPLMVGIAVLVALGIALAVFFVLHRPTTSALDGRWTNPSAQGRNSLVQLEISGSGNQLAIHAWGLCPPANCDWGMQTASFDGQKAQATWSLMNDASGEEKGRAATLTISKSGSDKLEVEVANTYTGHAGNTHQSEFVRAQ
ncbi:toll/interleukin-1 receptor domain-containing protein [Alloacidobacterium dinghuense]|uniref:Toll/interleukin-1 receptor domain-containing protein n=1 Tax=Alloacidobacterium dinghuense TaxID=2763107 RepID=A0A7G8BRH9_9BACT|nr:toll/interleukin-1 receptor domain-containing protein [Alloacidobacterium dinghuense]